jgi:predicted transcriptional regulator
MQDQLIGKKQVAMTLRLDPGMAKELRQVAEAMSMPVSSYARKTLARGIVYSQRNELKYLADPRIKAILSKTADPQEVL